MCGELSFLLKNNFSFIVLIRPDLYTEYNAKVSPGHGNFFVCDFSTGSIIKKHQMIVFKSLQIFIAQHLSLKRFQVHNPSSINYVYEKKLCLLKTGCEPKNVLN